MFNQIIEEDLKRLFNGLSTFIDQIKGKTFLITGGAGFLGSWFCDIINMFPDTKIICLDNFSSGSKENIEYLIQNKGFKLIEGNVCDFKTDEEIDYIIHMASIASPPIYQKYPIQTLDANVIGTKNMLNLAKNKNVKSFLLTSTSEIYGNPPNSAIPTPESYYGYVSSYGPRSMYDEGKRCAEAYCYSYFKDQHLHIRIARIFNTYGPRLDIKSTSQYGRVVVKFIDQALNNQPITVYGDGTQTRSFCYITDLIGSLIVLLLMPKINGEVVNIGNDTETTVLELAKKILKLTKSSSKIAFSTLPPDDPRRRCPDITKAKELLNCRPKISLEEGLVRTIEWYKSMRIGERQ